MRGNMAEMEAELALEMYKKLAAPDKGSGTLGYF